MAITEISLQPYKIAPGATDYPEKHNAAMDGLQGRMNQVVTLANTLATIQPDGIQIADYEFDASPGAYPANPSQGDVYLITTAGTIDGVELDEGDMLLYTGTDWLFSRGIGALLDQENAWTAEQTFSAGLTITGSYGWDADGNLAAKNGDFDGTVRRGGSDAYARDDILGTVSQSSGVPTGAIIERGSNANGEYTRYADGTQICWQSLSTASSAAVAWTYPAAFSDFPAVVGLAQFSSGARIITAGAPGSASVDIFSWNESGDGSVSPGARVMAMGRWF